MDTIDVMDTASATAKKLRVVLAALGDIDPDNEILDGSIGILWDIHDVISSLANKETYEES